MRTAIMMATALLAMAASEPRTYSAIEAVQVAKTTGHGVSGRFEMTVAAAGVSPNGTFLNSTADFRADDNLTFRLSPIVARMVARRYGAPAQTYLQGRHVVVDGVVAEQPIARTVGGRARSLARWQHEVAVTRFEQIVRVD